MDPFPSRRIADPEPSGRDSAPARVQGQAPPPFPDEKLPRDNPSARTPWLAPSRNSYGEQLLPMSKVLTKERMAELRAAARGGKEEARAGKEKA